MTELLLKYVMTSKSFVLRTTGKDFLKFWFIVFEQKVWCDHWRIPTKVDQIMVFLKHWLGLLIKQQVYLFVEYCWTGLYLYVSRVKSTSKITTFIGRFVKASRTFYTVLSSLNYHIMLHYKETNQLIYAISKCMNYCTMKCTMHLDYFR